MPGLPRRYRPEHQDDPALRAAPRGQCLNAAAPFGHCKTTTFVAGLWPSGLCAPLVLDGPMNARAFLAYVRQVLTPELTPEDIVVMDNLPAHKVQDVRAAIKATGAQLFFLPPYSPDLNPIEMSSPSSRRFSGISPSDPETASGAVSDPISTSSSQPNAATISQPPAMYTQSEIALAPRSSFLRFGGRLLSVREAVVERKPQPLGDLPQGLRRLAALDLAAVSVVVSPFPHGPYPSLST
nr:transposase [Arenibaculum pallidiluteum]